jgi:hypothetical protein
VLIRCNKTYYTIKRKRRPAISRQARPSPESKIQLRLKGVFYVSEELILFLILAVGVKHVSVEEIQAEGQHNVVPELKVQLGRDPALIIVGKTPQDFRP